MNTPIDYPPVSPYLAVGAWIRHKPAEFKDA